MSTQSILTMVERIQRNLYLLKGENPELVLKQFDSKYCRQNYFQYYIENFPPKYHADFDDQFSQLIQFRTTAYQDPVILRQLTQDFPSVKKVAGILFPESIKVSAPLLATVPVPILNGITLRDQFGCYGILLREGMRFWPTELAKIMLRFVAPEGKIDQSSFNEGILRDRVDDNFEAAVDLMTLLLFDVTREGLPVSRDPEKKCPSKNLMRMILSPPLFEDLIVLFSLMNTVIVFVAILIK
jgi:hypothetical protein